MAMTLVNFYSEMNIRDLFRSLEVASFSYEKLYEQLVEQLVVDAEGNTFILKNMSSSERTTSTKLFLSRTGKKTPLHSLKNDDFLKNSALAAQLAKIFIEEPIETQESTFFGDIPNIALQNLDFVLFKKEINRLDIATSIKKIEEKMTEINQCIMTTSNALLETKNAIEEKENAARTKYNEAIAKHPEYTVKNYNDFDRLKNHFALLRKKADEATTNGIGISFLITAAIVTVGIVLIPATWPALVVAAVTAGGLLAAVGCLALSVWCIDKVQKHRERKLDSSEAILDELQQLHPDHNKSLGVRLSALKSNLNRLNEQRDSLECLRAQKQRTLKAEQHVKNPTLIISGRLNQPGMPSPTSTNEKSDQKRFSLN